MTPFLPMQKPKLCRQSYCKCLILSPISYFQGYSSLNMLKLFRSLYNVWCNSWPCWKLLRSFILWMIFHMYVNFIFSQFQLLLKSASCSYEFKETYWKSNFSYAKISILTQQCMIHLALVLQSFPDSFCWIKILVFASSSLKAIIFCHTFSMES